MGRRKKQLRVLQDAIQPRAQKVKQSLCNWSFIVSAAKTCGLVLFYYCFSISLTFWNQRFIHKYQFPLSITMFHLVMKFIMAATFRWLWECKSGKRRVMLSWSPYIKRVAPPGIFSSLDIALSNWSLEFITVSLYTMSKTTVIVFILGFSLLFRLEKMRCSLVVVVLFIFTGLFLFSYESTQFSPFGFILVMLASFLSGLRWTLSQVVLQKSELGLTNPLDMMYHIQPWMVLALLPLSASIEGVKVATTKYAFDFETMTVLTESLLLVMVGGLQGFMLEFSEFLLLTNTSSLTLSIAGIFKEICILLMAAGINGDEINGMNVVGLVLCLSGIIVHVFLKATTAASQYTQFRREKQICQEAW